MNGEPFDQASLKGKVVLVDFWATWCGPCIAEVPHVLVCYEKYHDKGFEVIGISLDNDRERLEKFIADKQLPWPILFEPKEEEQAWNNPLVKLYSIAGIPAMFVIDTHGNVISLTARGDRLTKILEEQLGPAESTKDTVEEKPST